MTTRTRLRRAPVTAAMLRLAEPETANKYGARRVQCGDHMHPSEKERSRCYTLQMRERLGEIHGLRRQTRWPICVNGVAICTYVSDFDYGTPSISLVVEDTKGYRTREYLIKRKLMQAVYNVTILET